MDATWLGAIASVASALVVGVTAVAAFLQIRHIRNANEIAVYIRLFDRLDSPEAAAAFRAIGPYVERARTDAAFRAQLAYERVLPEFAPIASLLQFLEHLSTLIAVGNMSERLVLAEYAENIVNTWDSMAEVIYLRRNVLSPYTCAAFEHLAMRARAYIENGELKGLYAKLEHDPKMAGFTIPARPAGDTAARADSGSTRE